MPRLPRRYILRQKSPNAPPRIQRALGEISEPLTTIVDFDWDSYNAGCQKLIGVIKSSKASVREPTESGSGSPETKDQSIVMAEISYPTDAEGAPVEHEKLPDRVWPFRRWWPCHTPSSCADEPEDYIADLKDMGRISYFDAP